MRKSTKVLLVLISVFMLLALTCCVENEAPVDISAAVSPGGEIPASGSEPSETEQPPSLMPAYSGVKTDYSYLTPYDPFGDICTRLAPSDLPELEPSPDYGMLLPYLGELMQGSGGYPGLAGFGLVTADGMIVTDPVYSRIERGSYSNSELPLRGPVPIYILTRSSAEENTYAVCALDGSWATAFEYREVTCSDEVVFLMRDGMTYDIDVMDYDGRLLLNVKSLDIHGDILTDNPWLITHGYGEGRLTLPLKNGGTAYVDVQTKKTAVTDFQSGKPFSEGMAAVAVDGLFGYMNSEYELVIEPQFWSADPFFDGVAVVAYSRNSFAVIDTEGTVLYTDYTNPYRPYAGVYALGDSFSRLLDSEFNPIMVDGRTPRFLKDGWMCYLTDAGATILRGDESYDLPGVTDIQDAAGNLVSFGTGVPTAFGVMTLDGEILIEQETDCYMMFVTDKETGELLIVKNKYGKDMSTSFSVFDMSGNEIFADN
ncbi:MAG: WG repeat-containing protein, partial [Clostridiales bacterium]|nr:WG repeat-containing protein [Clostridiales bacterium]